jgi:hypothetical protein
MYTAKETLYLKNGQAVNAGAMPDGGKNSPVYLVTGACISNAEAIRVGLKSKPTSAASPTLVSPAPTPQVPTK